MMNRHYIGCYALDGDWDPRIVNILAEDGDIATQGVMTFVHITCDNLTKETEIWIAVREMSNHEQ